MIEILISFYTFNHSENLDNQDTGFHLEFDHLISLEIILLLVVRQTSLCSISLIILLRNAKMEPF